MANTSRNLYVSSGGYVLGSWWPLGRKGWLHPAQAEPYLGTILTEETPEHGEVDTGARATAIMPPASARSVVRSSLTKIR